MRRFSRTIRKGGLPHLLARLLKELRRVGVVVSPGEALDAAWALDAILPRDRALVRVVLEVTLCKDADAVRLFSPIFERIFVPPAVKEPGGGTARKERGEAGRPKASGLRSGGGFQPPEWPRLPASEVAETSSLRGGRGQRQGREPRRPEPDDSDRRRRLEARKHGRTRGTAAAPARRQGARLEDATTPEDLLRDLPRLYARLRWIPSRRRRPGNSGRLDVHRLLRRSLATSSVPFALPFRRAIRKQPRLVLLLDVSQSVAAAAGSFLLLASCLLHRFRETRILLFVDRIVDATGSVLAWLSGDLPAAASQGSKKRPRVPDKSRRFCEALRPAGSPTSFQVLLESLRDLDLGHPSDYGSAFYDLKRHHAGLLDRSTLWVVVGDGRTNRFDPCPWLLEELSQRVRRTIWLAPEPEAEWGTADSALPTYAEIVQVLEATSIEVMASVFRQLE